MRGSSLTLGLLPQIGLAESSPSVPQKVGRGHCVYVVSCEKEASHQQALQAIDKAIRETPSSLRRKFFDKKHSFAILVAEAQNESRHNGAEPRPFHSYWSTPHTKQEAIDKLSTLSLPSPGESSNFSEFLKRIIDGHRKYKRKPKIYFLTDGKCSEDTLDAIRAAEAPVSLVVRPGDRETVSELQSQFDAKEVLFMPPMQATKNSRRVTQEN